MNKSTYEPTAQYLPPADWRHWFAYFHYTQMQRNTLWEDIRKAKDQWVKTHKISTLIHQQSCQEIQSLPEGQPVSASMRTLQQEKRKWRASLKKKKTKAITKSGKIQKNKLGLLIELWRSSKITVRMGWILLWFKRHCPKVSRKNLIRKRAWVECWAVKELILEPQRQHQERISHWEISVCSCFGKRKPGERGK